MANQKKFSLGVPGASTQVFDQNVVTIGRGADSDFRIDKGIVSRKHAEILRSSKGFVVFALSKTNPLAVDGESVAPEQTAPLRDGSRIVLSNKIEVVFAFAEEGAEPKSEASRDEAPSPKEPAEKPSPPSDGSAEAQTDAFEGELLSRVRRSLASKAQAAGQNLARPTIPLKAVEDPGALTKLEEPTAPRGDSAKLSRAAPPAAADPSADAARSLPALAAESGLLSKLFAKAPEAIEVISAPRPREGPPGAALQVEAPTGNRRVEVFDDLLIGAGPDSDVVIQGAYAPRRAAVAVRIGGTYRLYNVSPSPQTVRLNGRAIEGQAALQDGDEVEVYGVRLQVTIPAR